MTGVLRDALGTNTAQHAGEGSFAYRGIEVHSEGYVWALSGKQDPQEFWLIVSAKPVSVCVKREGGGGLAGYWNSLPNLLRAIPGAIAHRQRFLGAFGMFEKEHHFCAGVLDRHTRAGRFRHCLVQAVKVCSRAVWIGVGMQWKERRN